MVVWLEVALLENALLDGVLLYLALKCARMKVKVWRLLLAAALGGAEGVLFPVLGVPVWCAYLLKILGGVLLVLVAAAGKRKQFFIALALFFGMTFALGGLLVAAYSFFGVEYEGGVYLVERAPVGLVLGGAALFAIVAVCLSKKLYRYRKERREILDVTLTAGEREVHWQGFADSGNLLSFRGEPVCVASPAALFALFGKELCAKGRITVETVNGGRESPVFECDRLRIGKGKKAVERRGVFLTVGDVGKEYQLVLSCALMEG